MKKFLFSFLLLILAAPASASFSDVPSEYIYFEAIDYLQEKGIVQGYDDGTYQPNQDISRAEFTKIIIAITSTLPERQNCVASRSFTDTNTSHWYYPYVCLALKKGIVQGYFDGSFRPQSEVNYAEALKISLEAAGADVTPQGGKWYEKYTQFAIANNLTFAHTKEPAQLITRGEIAALIFWLHNLNYLNDPCILDTDCEIGSVCTNYFCQKIYECSKNSDCPTGYDCWNQKCRLTKVCYATSDCPSGYTCANNMCQTVANRQCVVDADCLNAQYCSSYQCVTTPICRATSNCPRAYHCLDLKCQQDATCDAHIDCPTGYECEARTHTCLEMDNCTSNDDCPTSFKCQEERCQLPSSFYN